MKFALGLLVCCLLVIAGTVIFAPEYAHEIIDRFHENPTASDIIQVDENNEGDSDNDNDSAITPLQDDETGNIVEPNTRTKPHQSTNNLHESGTVVEPPPTPQPIKDPRTRNEMSTWLRENNYLVAIGQGFYRIIWQTQKRIPSKPVNIRLWYNGTITPNYEQKSYNVTAGRRAIINRYTITTSSGGVRCSTFDGGIDIALGQGEIIINMDWITITASVKYENSSWWIVKTHSFDWELGQDRIGGVLSKAKKIKELNNEN